jgi:hypothetical protein
MTTCIPTRSDLLMSQTPAQSRYVVATGKAHGAAVGPLPLRRPTHRGAVGFPKAYTLIEVLVVAVIVVLMLGMALPVFRAITGSRSEAGASNIIASMLGRARTDAIGLQKDIGVAFLYNPSTQVQSMAEVQFPDCPQWLAGGGPYFPGNCVSNSGTPTQYYLCIQAPTSLTMLSNATFWQRVNGPPLEMIPNTELVALPSGIAVQTLCNCQFSSSLRSTDGYLSVGVILFDFNGQLKADYYGISGFSRLATASGLNTDSTTNGNYPSSNQVGSPFTGIITQPGVQSQFGLVVFQKDAFVSQNFSAEDPAYTTANSSQANAYTSTGTPTQQTAETWLDQNATPLLIDRYTGTLIRGE